MRARLRAAKTDESSASLVFALIIITVVGLVSVGILTLGQTSIRSTVSMRTNASAMYASDGAVEVALNQLRLDNFNGVASGCDGTTQVLSNVYPATATTPGASAAVTCMTDGSGGGLVGGNTSPGTAVLTLATGTEPGIMLDHTNNASLKVRGGIFSNSTIELTKPKADLENVATNSYAYALGGCVGSAQLLVAAGSSRNCNYVPGSDIRGLDPGTLTGHGLSFDPPAGPGTAQTVPGCATTPRAVYDLSPGLYTNAAALNTLIACGGGSVVHLTPGTYFFNFAAGTPTFDVSTGYLVGGTAASSLTTTPTMPGSCVPPGASGSTTTSGVELVFGGVSRLRLSGGGNIELCASNAASGPPVVIYGLKTAVGTVPAESGCITALGYPMLGDTAHCAVLSTDNSPSPFITLWGTTYIPKAAVELTSNNNNVSVFQWGLLSRVMRFHATGSAAMTRSVISVPDDAPSPYAVTAKRYINVYVCLGKSTCAASGANAGVQRIRVTALVSTTAPRTVTITSWATLR